MALTKGECRLGTIMVVSGPSGAGKSTLCKKLRERVTDLEFSVSCTTRSPRPGEIDGVHYYFLDKTDFEARIARREFIEYARVFDNYYGTLYSEVADRVRTGSDVFLDIDVQGAMQIRERAANDELLKQCTEFVFISPPSYTELERRLRGRGTETEEAIRKRLAESSREMAQWSKYDYLIVNDDCDAAAEELYCVLQSFRVSRKRITATEFYHD